MKNLLTAFLIWMIFTPVVYANPSFYFSEGNSTVIGHDHSVSLFLDSDGSTITAAQTVVTFPSSYLAFDNILMSDYQDETDKPNCIAAPFDPSLALGYKISPYYDEDSKIYLSCGFPGGYQSQSAGGDKLATITFSADVAGTATLSLDATNTKFYYIGDPISPGAMSNYAISILTSIEPTPAPGETPERATDSISASDLNFVEVGSTGTTSITSQSSSAPVNLEVVESDDVIPPPPDDLPERDRLTSLSLADQNQVEEQPDPGEVLSAQSLRELLIPGKSTADKTVVLVNLISVLSFLVILAIVVWKLISVKRLNQIKNQHLADLLTGELATIESKINSTDNQSKNNLKSDLGDTIRKISEQVSETT